MIQVINFTYVLFVLMYFEVFNSSIVRTSKILHLCAFLQLVNRLFITTFVVCLGLPFVFTMEYFLRYLGIFL